jgi:hypothetical protein
MGAAFEVYWEHRSSILRQWRWRLKMLGNVAERRLKEIAKILKRGEKFRWP